MGKRGMGGGGIEFIRFCLMSQLARITRQLEPRRFAPDYDAACVHAGRGRPGVSPEGRRTVGSCRGLFAPNHTHPLINPPSSHSSSTGANIARN